MHKALGSIVAAAMMTVSGVANGQIAATPGSIAQVPPPPEPQKPLPDIRIERRGSVSDNGPSGPAVVVSTLHVTGATRFSESTLVAAAGFKPGGSLTISELRRMAASISNYYNDHGYTVAQAYVPTQEIIGGVVTIAVIEGRYGEVTLNNRSRLRDGTERAILRGLDSGDIVEAAPLRHRLLLLADTPGVNVDAVLAPGSSVGSSDLKIDLTNGPLFSGSLQVDNDGNPYTGRWRGGGTLNLNDPLGIGDQASIRVLTSGDGLQYIRGSYQVQTGEATVGFAYEDFHYDLGNQFGVPSLNGTEQIASVYASYPLIRSDLDTMRLVADFDYRWLRNDNDTPALEGNRRAEVGNFGITGEHRDHFGAGGSDAYALSVSVGNLDIRSPSALVADGVTARTQGDYAVFRGSVDRLQDVGGPFQIYGWARGQAASRNLDIDEKMELGGAYAVRAYPEGEAYGDEGFLGTVEARMWLPKPWASMPGRLQLAVFEDVGFVRFAVQPWLPGPDSATRAGAGIGLTWAQLRNFLVRVSYSHRTGTPAATSYPESNGELRFEAVKFF